MLAVAAFVAWHQVKEARGLREQQIRPFVVIDFEVEDFLIFLAVSNIGNALARDVRFKIDPAFSTAIENPLDEMKLLRDGTSTLAPGKKIRTLFDSALQRKPDDYPDLYRVGVTYSDEQARRRFDETLDLDLGIYWNLSIVTRHGLHDVHERLKDIRNELKKWTSANGGILRLSPDESRAENERRKRVREARRTRREEGEPPTGRD